MHFALGFGLSAAIAVIAWRGRSLSASGAMAAVVVGTMVFGAGGLAWSSLLVLFFVSSSLLSRLDTAAKTMAGQRAAKGGRRDAAQVAANGGVAAAVALAQMLAPGQLWFAAYVGAIAAATADTWATELGTLSRRPPRLITTWRATDAGTSGAVSLPGTLAALAGGTVIGIAAGFATEGWSWWQALALGGAAGLIGTTADSLIGATIQACYHCPRCRQPTESPRHHCGSVCDLKRGLRGIDNDVVNGLATTAGALAAGALAAALMA